MVKRPTRHICEDCGAEFEGSPTARFCPACRKKRRQANVHVLRRCIVCGKEFSGAPRSLYCPECRVSTRHENYRRYIQRKKEGCAIVRGETVMNCERCGKPFVVMAGGQRYCSDCAKEAYVELDRAQSRAWAERAKKAREQEEK